MQPRGIQFESGCFTCTLLLIAPKMCRWIPIRALSQNPSFSLNFFARDHNPNFWKSLFTLLESDNFLHSSLLYAISSLREGKFTFHLGDGSVSFLNEQNLLRSNASRSGCIVIYRFNIRNPSSSREALTQTIRSSHILCQDPCQAFNG